MALYGSGVEIVVPQPSRYAVHKLVVAQVRAHSSAKRAKDLAQSRELIEALAESAPDSVHDAIEDALRRGGKWRAHVSRSLQEIRRPDLARN